MKVVFFVHAVASCWNNGNAHFLRGIGAELQLRGHDVVFCEPEGAWSETNLLRDHGPFALRGFERAFPGLQRVKYIESAPDLDRLTDNADLVIVHEWNAPALVNALGVKRRRGASFVLFFHDTHHRALSDPDAMARYALEHFDGVLAFGAVLTELYRRRGWANRVWTWHEAADTSLFFPRPLTSNDADVVWVGNWGDEERTAELEEFLLRPVARLGLSADIFGVRYPERARAMLTRRGFQHGGWLANHIVPEVFARHRVTVHVPRRPYVAMLRGIPTIRVFEALACGIPLVSAPWDDVENLFPKDCFLMASNGEEMRAQLQSVIADQALADTLREGGVRVIQERHTCRHRVQELLDFYRSVRAPGLGARQTEAA